MRTLVRSVLGIALLCSTARFGFAMCDPAGADAADIAAARAAIAANCDCAASPSHGAYVSCAAGQAQTTLVNKSCQGKVVRCAARSTCGKPGFVVCCRADAAGMLKCSTKSGCDHCTPPDGGSACCSTETSCCGATGVDKAGACDASNTPPCATTTTVP